jgi:hypothetical protein
MHSFYANMKQIFDQQHVCTYIFMDIQMEDKENLSIFWRG